MIIKITKSLAFYFIGSALHLMPKHAFLPVSAIAAVGFVRNIAQVHSRLNCFQIFSMFACQAKIMF